MSTTSTSTLGVSNPARLLSPREAVGAPDSGEQPPRPLTALARPEPVITSEQLDLVKRTIATGATAEELKLFLYDCARRGVHPLDKLIHFTKRGGKYTPITSIDFMRTRAHETGECAGIDDAVFAEMDQHTPSAASVTVYRLVQGTRYAFTATARWAEYKPEQNDFMWRKMPHTMLGKCAEALALRKAFPQQLAGLYASEEMDQAGRADPPAVVVTATDVNTETGEVVDAPAPTDGLLRVVRVTSTQTRNKNVQKHAIALSDARTASTINDRWAELAEQLCQSQTPIEVETKETRFGLELTAIRRQMTPQPATPEPVPELTDADIPF